MFLLLIAIFGIVLFLVEKFIRPLKKSHPAVLYLRSFSEIKETKQDWYAHKSENIFAQELCDEYLVVSVPLDCGVMSYAKEIDFLKQQEDQHAKLHTLIMKDHPAAQKYKFWKKVLKLVLLKTPQWLSENILGNVETSFGNGMWITQMTLGKFWSNLLIFHWFEESEHGAVTSSFFKHRYNALIRLILAPIGVLCLALLWVLPIFMKLYYTPRIWLYPKTYLDLVIYLGAITLGWLLNVAECLVFWILPFEHSTNYYKYVRSSFEKQIKERKIEFKVIKEKEYIY